MSREPRVNTTTIRYSDSVLKIVNKVSGKTFADKFEFIVLDYNSNKQKREKHIRDLDKQILEKTKKLELLKQELTRYNTIVEKAELLEKAILDLTNKCIYWNALNTLYTRYKEDVSLCYMKMHINT